MKNPLRFIIVPKVAHPWYAEVHRGARDQAALLSAACGVRVVVDFLPPTVADRDAQDAVLSRIAGEGADGLAVDLVDAWSHLPALEALRRQGLPVVVFDAPSPRADVPGVGNDFARQGVLAAERLVALLGGVGKVALMRGCPDAPNHKERYEAQVAVLTRHPGITLVDGGTDHDDIETARTEALAVLAAHPDLDGYLCCDASGPVGIAAAVQESGRRGRVKVVGMDGIQSILQAIKEGVIESSAATIPRMQGSLVILLLWQAVLGGPLPHRVDTGIDMITGDNVDAFLRDASDS